MLFVPGINRVASEDALWRCSSRTVDDSNGTPILGFCNCRRDILVLCQLIPESIEFTAVPPHGCFLTRSTFRLGLHDSLFVSWWKPLDSFRESYSACLTLLLLWSITLLYAIFCCIIFGPYIAVCRCARTLGTQLKSVPFLHCFSPLLSLLMKSYSMKIWATRATLYKMCQKLGWHPVWTAVWPTDLPYKALWSFSLGYLEFNLSAFLYPNICGQLAFFC